LARRELFARTRVRGDAALHVEFMFEATNCPRCGAQLIKRCGRCKSYIYAPVADRCESCGVPHPWVAERQIRGERLRTRQWDKRKDPSDPADPVYVGPRGTVWVIDADIVRLDVQALVSNTDMYGGMWTEVADAVRRAAGDEVVRLAQRNIPRKPGEAWATEASALDGRLVIHVASMKRNGESDLRLVARSLWAAFAKASESSVESVGVPAIGTGPKALPMDDWLRTFGQVAVRYTHRAYDPEEDAREAKELAIVLVLYEPEHYDEQHRELGRAVRSAWHGLGRPATGKPQIDLNRLDRVLVRLRVEALKLPRRRKPPGMGEAF
jgi:O-acetyl-ADP-ribose deacetylase (regulator of RNase III)/predicted RNA-binding Zn-ribbon protein involved in translation (DUF1610 family)